jgi:hypothetical protein
MPHIILNDPVNVTVDFNGKSIKPQRVIWDNKAYIMKHVNLVHPANEGNKRIFYFSVSDDSLFMKLRFDTDSMQWRLVEVYTE